jgi:hypothetical protein
MDPINVIYKIQRLIKEQYQAIGETMISGGVDNMEKYKYLMGQAHAYFKLSQEISTLLKQDEKEQTDEQKPDLTNVVKFDTKN